MKKIAFILSITLGLISFQNTKAQDTIKPKLPVITPTTNPNKMAQQRSDLDFRPKGTQRDIFDTTPNPYFQNNMTKDSIRRFKSDEDPKKKY